MRIGQLPALRTVRIHNPPQQVAAYPVTLWAWRRGRWPGRSGNAVMAVFEGAADARRDGPAGRSPEASGAQVPQARRREGSRMGCVTRQGRAGRHGRSLESPAVPAPTRPGLSLDLPALAVSCFRPCSQLDRVNARPMASSCARSESRRSSRKSFDNLHHCRLRSQHRRAS